MSKTTICKTCKNYKPIQKKYETFNEMMVKYNKTAILTLLILCTIPIINIFTWAVLVWYYYSERKDEVKE